MMKRQGAAKGAFVIDNRVAIKLIVISATAILVLPVFAPAVAAKGPRGGRVVSVEHVVNVQPDDSVDWTVLANMANNSDHRYLDYNLTWEPFYENNTDLKGTTIHTNFAPMQFALNTTNETVSTGSLFKLSPEQIMDGLSEVWFRIPVLDIPDNATITNRVYRISSGTAFNFSFSDFGKIDTENEQLMALVHNITIDPNISNVTTILHHPEAFAHHDYRRWQNITVPGSNDTLHYNFTYLKACLGMFPNEWYLSVFDIYAPYADGMKLAITVSDFGSDGAYNSWVWCAGESYYMPIDLDTSFVGVCGVSNGITGIGTDTQTRAWTSNNLFCINSSIPIDQTIDLPEAQYFNILLPVFANPLTFPDTLSVIVRFYSGMDDSTLFYRTSSVQQYLNGTYHSFMTSVDLAVYDGYYIDHIQIEFKMQGLTEAPNSTYLRLWGVQHTVNSTHVGYTDMYWVGFTSYPGTYYWVVGERQFFVPYGYYGLDTWYWNMTNATFVTIPIDVPETGNEIVESIVAFEAYLKGLHEDEDGDWWESFKTWAFHRIWDFVDFVYNTVGRVGADIINWICKLTPLDEFLNWLLDGGISIFEFFGAIGIWLWDILNLLIDALEWFTYWAVRMIYAASIMIVYMVNIFGIISINSALLNVSRTGNGRDFVYAFRAGWKFVLGIITLLLSLAIMAISIVSAVVPF